MVGIESPSKSSRSLPDRLHLALFLPGNSAYLADIEQIIQRAGINERYQVINSAESVVLDLNIFDCALFLFEADRGISPEEIEAFHKIRELQIPTLIAIGSLIPKHELDNRWDFDDMVMLANRVLEPVVAPYLVLHDDKGLPNGFFDLIRKKVLNYSSGKMVEEDGESELSVLVEEFQNEFDQFDFHDEDFLSGLYSPAIPFIPEKNLGIDQIEKFITKLAQARL
jgi:hypothetical protein